MTPSLNINKTYLMKTNSITILILSALVFFGTLAQTKAAGPETYKPVATMKQAQSIKPGDQIACVCGGCGAVKTMTADKARSFLRGFTCDNCKSKFVLRQNAHGEARADFVYEDAAKHVATLLKAS